jgi:Flp pilus assembly pilin Flp
MFTQGSLKFRKHFAALARDESGQALTEYALILALVSLVGLGLTPLGQTLAQMITDISVAI